MPHDRAHGFHDHPYMRAEARVRDGSCSIKLREAIKLDPECILLGRYFAAMRLYLKTGSELWEYLPPVPNACLLDL